MAFSQTCIGGPKCAKCDGHLCVDIFAREQINVRQVPPVSVKWRKTVGERGVGYCSEFYEERNYCYRHCCVSMLLFFSLSCSITQDIGSNRNA